MAKKIKWKTLIACIAAPLVVGGLSAVLTQGSMEEFEKLEKPPLSPPGWLFPIVWSILYILMGIASYLVLESGGAQRHINKALFIYSLQLFINFFWTIWFFNLGLYVFSFIWLVLLWLAIIATIVLFCRVSKTAAWLLVPYLIWVTFAGYLNLAIAILN